MGMAALNDTAMIGSDPAGSAPQASDTHQTVARPQPLRSDAQHRRPDARCRDCLRRILGDDPSLPGAPLRPHGHRDGLSQRKPEAATSPPHRHFAAPIAGGAQTVAEVAVYMELVMTGEKAAGLKVLDDPHAVRRDLLPVRRHVRAWLAESAYRTGSTRKLILLPG